MKSEAVAVILVVCLVFVNFSSSEAFLCNDHNCPSKRLQKLKAKRTFNRIVTCNDGRSLCLESGPSDVAEDTAKEAQRVNNIIRRINAIRNSRQRSLATDLDISSD